MYLFLKSTFLNVLFNYSNIYRFLFLCLIFHLLRHVLGIPPNDNALVYFFSWSCQILMNIFLSFIMWYMQVWNYYVFPVNWNFWIYSDFFISSHACHLYDINVASSSFPLLVFAWHIFPIFLFQVFCVSCFRNISVTKSILKQFCFFYLLTGEFSPFTLIAIFDMYSFLFTLLVYAKGIGFDFAYLESNN